MLNDQIIYGIHPVEELLRTRLTSVDHVYFNKERKNEQTFSLMKICRRERLSYNLVPEMKLRQIAGSSRHQGVAALCSIHPYIPIDRLKVQLSKETNPLVVLPASIEDPGNLGAIIRSCVAMGADALLLERKHTSPLGAAVAKSSAGMVEHIPIARPKNLEAIVADFKNEGYKIIGADMKGGTLPQSTPFTGPLILILGGEHRSIPPYLMKLCTNLVTIPMSDKAHSLNVSASAAILLYEIARQRSTSS